jgi:adenine-specific DNA glycosylase
MVKINVFTSPSLPSATLTTINSSKSRSFHLKKQRQFNLQTIDFPQQGTPTSYAAVFTSTTMNQQLFDESIIPMKNAQEHRLPTVPTIAAAAKQIFAKGLIDSHSFIKKMM